MYTYTAYSLDIRSHIPLLGLVEGEAGKAAPDVKVTLSSLDRFPEGEGRPFLSATERAFLHWEEAGKFLVQRGSEITVDPRRGAEDSVFQEYLLGPVLAMLLYQRGLLVLHASAVGVNGRAVLFLGKSGQGKSTMAAALYARGHSIIADDITAVQFAAGGPVVLPGVPQLRLLPDASTALGEPVEAAVTARDSDKTAYRADRGRQTSPLPLARIYALADGATHESERLPPRDAVAMLARHSYVTNAIEATGTTASHFHECAVLARRVPVNHLKRKRSLASIADLARLVEEDLA